MHTPPSLKALMQVFHCKYAIILKPLLNKLSINKVQRIQEFVESEYRLYPNIKLE